MDEEDSAMARQNNVGSAWKGADVDAEAIASAMKQRADRPLGAGVLSLDLGHESAAFFDGQRICHVGRIGQGANADQPDAAFSF